MSEVLDEADLQIARVAVRSRTPTGNFCKTSAKTLRSVPLSAAISRHHNMAEQRTDRGERLQPCTRML